MEKIVYLSYAQGNNIDGALLAKSVSAVMIRAGQGIWEDTLFWYNYNLCLDHHIPFGVWWFWQPNMRAVPQIEAFLKLWIKLPYKPNVIALDVEEIDYYDEELQPDGTFKRVWKKLFPPSKKQSNDDILLWCQTIKDTTKANVGIYTRKFYFEDWTFEDSKWYQFFMWIAAWYNYTGQVPPALPWKWPEYKMHQYEGGGLGTPGVDPANTCKEYFNGSHEELLTFFGIQEVKENTMASMPIQTTLQANRARVFTWRANQALKNLYPDQLGVKAIILPMGGYDKWDGSHMLIYQEPTFKGRFRLVSDSKIPVIGRYNLHAGRWGIEQFGNTTLIAQSCGGDMDEAQKEESARNNLILPSLLGAWCDGNFSMDALFSKTLKWLDIKALELSMVETVGFKGNTVNDYWQALAWNHAVGPLRWLQLRNYIPNIPIIMYTGDWFLSQYQNDLGIALSNSKSWLYFHFGAWTLKSTATFKTLSELFGYPPEDNYSLRGVPEGYSHRVLLHEFSDQTQKCEQVIGSDGLPTTVSLSLWQDTDTEMFKFLNVDGVPVIVPPPGPPPVTTGKIKTLEEAIAAIEKLQEWQGRIKAA